MKFQTSPWIAAIATTCMVLPISTDLWAQTVDAATRAKAEKIFDQADANMTNKNYAHACPQFEDVVALLPEAIGAHEALGECYEALGKLATSWRVYQVALSMAEKKGAADRIPVIREKIQALEGRYATVTVKTSAKWTDSVKIALSLGKHARDEVHVNVPIPVDRGTHVVDVQSGRNPRVTHKVIIKSDGEQAQLEVQEPADKPIPSPLPSPLRPWAKPLGWTMVGLGGVALATGVVLASMAKQNNAASNDGVHCTSTNLCDSIGWPLRDRAITQANASIGMFIAGSIIAASGFGVALTLPQKRSQGMRASPWQVGVFPTGMMLRNDF